MKAFSGERRNAVPSLNPASGSPPGRRTGSATGGAGIDTTGGGGGASGVGGGMGAGGASGAGAAAGPGAAGAAWATGAPGGTGICATAGTESSETRATAAVRDVFFIARHVTPHLLQPCGVGVKSPETRPEWPIRRDFARAVAGTALQLERREPLDGLGEARLVGAHREAHEAFARCAEAGGGRRDDARLGQQARRELDRRESLRVRDQR